MEGNIAADVSVRGGGGLIPLEDKWKEISQWTYPSEWVADLIPLEDKWKAISEWTYPPEGVADLIPLADKWKVISL